MLVEYYINIQHFAREVIDNIMARYIIVKFLTTRTSISDILTISDGIFNGLKSFMFFFISQVQHFCTSNKLFLLKYLLLKKKYLIEVVKGSMSVIIGQEQENFLGFMQVLISVGTRLVSCYLVSTKYELIKTRG